MVEQQQHEEVDLMEEVEEYGEFEDVEEKEDEEVAKVDRVQLALIYSLQLAEAYVSHVEAGTGGSKLTVLEQDRCSESTTAVVYAVAGE